MVNQYLNYRCKVDHLLIHIQLQILQLQIMQDYFKIQKLRKPYDSINIQNS